MESPKSSSSRAAVPQWIGEHSPTGGGTWRPIVLNSWPMNPSGAQATSPIRPPERVTRASSFAVCSWSGANIAPKTVLTTSKLPSGKGRASASPSRNSMLRPSASVRRRARSSRDGT